MAQLRDSTIDGNLSLTGDITLQTDKGIHGVNPATGVVSDMLHMSNYGNTVIGYDNYVNQSGNTHIYGNDVVHYVASASNSNFRPYYRAGDVIPFKIITTGYISSSSKNLYFTIPITKPVIGSPTATATSTNGFVLRQNGYTHGSNGASDPVEYAKPTKYAVDSNYNSGFIVTAYFDVTTNATNNAPIGVYWEGTITLS